MSEFAKQLNAMLKFGDKILVSYGGSDMSTGFFVEANDHYLVVVSDGDGKLNIIHIGDAINVRRVQ